MQDANATSYYIVPFIQIRKCIAPESNKEVVTSPGPEVEVGVKKDFRG